DDDECNFVDDGGAEPNYLRERLRHHSHHFAIARISDGFHVANDTDDSQPRARAVETSPLHALSNRVLPRPEALCERSTDNANRRRTGAIDIGKFATLQQCLPHRLEITRRSRAHICEMKSSRLRRRRALRITADEIAWGGHR